MQIFDLIISLRNYLFHNKFLKYTEDVLSYFINFIICKTGGGAEKLVSKLKLSEIKSNCVKVFNRF